MSRFLDEDPGPEYDDVDDDLLDLADSDEEPMPPSTKRRGSWLKNLLAVAISLGVPWKAVHIAVNEERTAEVQRKWQERVGIGEPRAPRATYRGRQRPTTRRA